MRRFRTGLALGCAAAITAAAQTNPPARTIRQYDSRIQMHTTPITLLVPDDNFETQKGAPESMERDLILPDDLPRESPIRPTGPRTKALQQKQQKKDWLVPSSTDKEGEDILSDPRKKTDPSGWGWLADEVLIRQKKEEKKADQKETGSEEQDSSFSSPSVLPEESGNSRTHGPLLDTIFKPVSASTQTKEKGKEKADAGNTSATDKNRDGQKDRQDGPATAETRSRQPGVDQPTERRFGADATWGNDHLWDKSNRSASALPQTETLLSIHRFDAKKQGGNSDLSGLKADAGKAAADKTELDASKPVRRNFDAAGGFQPLPAVPVRDLGNTPWASGLPGKTLPGGSSPLAPQPGVTPSRPLELLTAPELPKPITEPWLR